MKMFHNDDCGELLTSDGLCPKCNFYPDMADIRMDCEQTARELESAAENRTSQSHDPKLDVAEREDPTIRIARTDLSALLTENAQLRAQVTELQAHSTAMVNAQLSRQVRAFHEKYGHPTRSTPCVPEMKEVQFRLRLITEEFFELLTACEIWPHLDEGHDPDEIHACEIIKDAISDDFAGTVDLPELIDALADLSYVIEGTAAAMGVNMAPVLAEVQRANMAKEPNGPDAKPVKLPGWTPPDIAGVLIQQGWIQTGRSRREPG